MIKILYVHGYNGKPDGESFQKLAKYAEVADFGGEKVEMHSFDYDAEDPYDALKRLNQYYFENNIDLIIGSSLGGFLAAGCDFTCRIVVNPCWVPSEELPKVGYTGYMEDYKSLEQYWGEKTKTIDTELCIGCFAPADELLGTKYMEEFKKHFKEVYEMCRFDWEAEQARQDEEWKEVELLTAAEPVNHAISIMTSYFMGDINENELIELLMTATNNNKYVKEHVLNIITDKQ
jgi:predicted esterase YcpF (UPF0227 family)